MQIKKGQRVVMFYRSANFDEEVFDDPYTFNILRDPNPHVGFGGTGAHYCIGANLARMTINLIFNAVADHMPDLKPIRRARTAAVGVAQRHQALAGRLSRARRSSRSRSSRVVDDRAPVVLRYLGACPQHHRQAGGHGDAEEAEPQPGEADDHPAHRGEVGHGDSIASTGAKKKPAPMYHADPARSEISTKRSHRGIPGIFCSLMPPRCLCLGKRRNYL